MNRFLYLVLIALGSPAFGGEMLMYNETELNKLGSYQTAFFVSESIEKDEDGCYRRIARCSQQEDECKMLQQVHSVDCRTGE